MNNIWTNDYNPFQGWKVLAWYDRMTAIRGRNFMAPVNVALDIIQGTSQDKKCGGFRCNFCMSDLEDGGKVARIPEDLLLSLPEFFSKWGVRSLCVAGHHSDPTMYRHSVLIEFLRLCHYHGLDVGLVSNGAYYTDDLLRAAAFYCTWTGWSINAGRRPTHIKITGSNTFDKIIENIKMTADIRDQHNLPHTIGYKFLITDDNFSEIGYAVELASKIGVNHFQIRPTELPEDRVRKIHIPTVEMEMMRALREFQKPGKFEVFGIREKFTPQLTKIQPRRCVASPLGSTWKADGDVVICPDRRWSADRFKLGNFVLDGPESIRERWGGPQHRTMIERVNNDLDNCIRCTSIRWHEIYEKCVEEDSLNVMLI